MTDDIEADQKCQVLKKKKEDWQEREGNQFRLRVIQVRITNKSLIAKAKRLEKRMLMVILYLTKHVVDQLREKRHVIRL